MNPLYKKLKTIVGNSIEPDQNTLSLVQNSSNLTLINGLNQTIFQINELGQWIYLNAEWEKLTGFSITETLGTDVIHLIHPDDQQKCTDFFQEIYKNNPQSSSARIRFLTNDDHLCWVNMRANSIANPVDNKVHLVGVISDITERVREYGLHQANYRTLHTLINNLCGLVYRGRNDRDWTMEFVSDGCFELTGYKPADMVNKTVTFGSLINPNDQELVWTNVQSALAENRSYEINYRIRTSNGNEKWVWERGKGNFSSNGELLSIEGLIVDITDYKRNKIKENEEILYKTKSKQPQRYLFMDRLDLAIIKNNTINDYNFTLLIVQIDRFNKLQNRYSANVIEQIILDVCERLFRTISPSDSLCMFEDGKFGILLEHIDSVNTATKVIKSIRAALLGPVLINNTETYLTLSIGVSISSDSAKSRKLIIQDAYTALSRAKSLGGSRYEIYDEEINARMYALDRMENEIRYALENNELLICYQPIAHLQENAITGLETQLFWNHPRRGKIPAKTFSPVKANDDIVLQLNRWISSTTANHILSWASRTDLKQDLCFIIQFCGEKIFSDGFLNQLEQLLLNSKYNKLKFLIKIPANAIHSLTAKNIETINTFIKQNIGFIVSMDNPEIPPDKEIMNLQVNSIQLNNISNIENNNDLHYLKAQIDFIHTMGMRVIISGIDTKEQFEVMQDLGCDYIQGDYISPPLESEDLAQFITEDNCCSFL
jgi:PAS domain S-box-containing protein/diguanylate cyclase (GGDEF)-like protein